MADITIKRALIAVYDKTGIVDFARALVEEFGVEIISTGGTARHLTEAGIPVTLVEEVTGFPEMLDGRVKTLHPKIHAAILADRDNPEHMRQLAEQGITPIDMVVVNLYPFEETIKKPDCTIEEAIEMIDIGGPCLLRAAAKNHRHVVVVCSSEGYAETLRWLRDEQPASTKTKDLLRWAGDGYATTSFYDAQVAEWLTRRMSEKHGWPTLETIFARNWGALRYGENPHQTADLWQIDDDSEDSDLTVADAEHSDQEEISFNNYIDANAALGLCEELACAGRNLWHRFPTGADSDAVRVDHRINEERQTRRNLPHIQKPEATYFVTFRLRRDVSDLTPEERGVVLDACRYWHGRKMTLHAVVVMPDHVHLLLTPHEIKADQWVPLGEIIHSVKRYSASEINKSRLRTGGLWQDECFDRIVRNEREFREKWEYMEANPVTAELVETSDAYEWFWCSDTEFMETVESTHRLETGATGQPSTAPVGNRCHSSASGRMGEEASPSQHAIVFIKHTNACGVGVNSVFEDSAESVASARIETYRRAYLGDPNAAMGGILAVNFDVDAGFAEVVMGSFQRWGKQAGAGAFFVEVWVAPSFQEEAVEAIRKAKKWGQRVRLLTVGEMGAPPDKGELDYKRIAGGMLVQDRDLVGLNEDQWKVVTERGPSDGEMADLRLAWLVCKHTKSNAISICRDGMLIGNGAGQMSRVMSCRIATWLAKENGHADKIKGAVAASDAFFPFRDGPDILADAGVTAIIQPGGSKRDAETIAACNERGLAMIFTGTRHFKH